MNNLKVFLWVFVISISVMLALDVGQNEQKIKQQQMEILSLQNDVLALKAEIDKG